MPDFTIKQGDVLPVFTYTLTNADGTSPKSAALLWNYAIGTGSGSWATLASFGFHLPGTSL